MEENKTIITLKGTGSNIRLEYYYDPTNKEWDSDYDLYSYNIILSNVEVFANGEDITKKKGKYIKTYPFTKDIVEGFECDPEAKNMLYRKADNDDDWDFEFEFEIPVSPQEFDPKKLQLIKSDYEFNEVPYAILADVIIYDGKEYRTEDDFDYAMTDFPEIEYSLQYTNKEKYDEYVKSLSE